MPQNRDYPPITPNTYRISLPAGQEFEFVSAHTIFPYVWKPISSGTRNNTYIQTVFKNGKEVFNNTYRIIVYREDWTETGGNDIGFTEKLENGAIYKIVYTFIGNIDRYDPSFTNTVSYTMSVVENKLPLKKWTVTDVLNRLCDLAEPIRKGEAPRFRLNGIRQDGTIISPENALNGEEVGQAYKLDKILSPQFSFTKETLRECLQEVGRFIHGEPFLTPKKENVLIDKRTFADGKVYIGSLGQYDTTGQYIVFIGGQQFPLKLESEEDDWYLQIEGADYSGSLYVYDANNSLWYYEVAYEMYARQDQSEIYTRPYIKKTVSEIIDSYTSYLDSTAENLVNQLDKYSGVIIEPYRDGAQSVRTENAYVRIEEGNMLIATRYPIYTIDKLEWIFFNRSIDITMYLFEKSVYDTQLSSYQEQYPYSKAYGLYYSQGQKNIGGLNFKVNSATGGVFKEYAILNILRQATNQSGLDITSYPQLNFRVTYTPYYNARVAQTKVNFKDFKYPAALIYNQQANVVESRYYGEHLKGAVARLGNVDKSLTYILYNVNLIPKAGQMFDRNYYISAVAVEMLPTCFLVTIGLSKDFNRLSAYIGINSEKRYSEISQNQAVERNTLYREFIVVGTEETPDSECLIGKNLLSMIADTFTQTGDYSPLSNVCAWGTSYKNSDIPGGNTALNLPIISSVFGNSISFSWQYEDNYSAGPTSVYQSSGNVTGYFQNSAPYTDYYGRLYYYNFDLQAQGPVFIPGSSLGLSLPQGTKPTASSEYVSTMGHEPYILRKDNREALQVNFQIDFVTNLDNLIIGSALASYCPAVRGTDSSIAAKLYVFDTELNKFTDHVEAYEDVDLSTMESTDVTVSVQDGYFLVNAGALPKTESGATNGKSWAIITNQYKKPAVQVEDEFGNVTEQQEVYGGDLLIGQNIEVTAGQAFTPIYFTAKHEIFDKSVWKDRV